MILVTVVLDSNLFIYFFAIYSFKYSNFIVHIFNEVSYIIILQLNKINYIQGVS